MPSRIEKPFALSLTVAMTLGTSLAAQTVADTPPPAWQGQAGTGYPPPGARAPAQRAPRDVPPPPGDRAAPGANDYAAPPPSTGLAVRYDQVGYAVWSNDTGSVAAAHPTLAPGSFAEVTALDSGRTILVPITGVSAPGREIELSGAAAQQLGLTQSGAAGVRVRSVNPTGADLGALSSGRAPPPRPDTPPVLLNALRRKLAGTLGQPRDTVAPAPAGRGAAARYAPPSAPMRTPVASAAPPRAPRVTGAGYYVQLAALSDAGRAAALARSVGGRVTPGGGINRVRTGPFASQAQAQAARDALARRGYADARIVREN